MTTHSEKDLREAEKIVERIRLTKRVTMEDVIDRAAEIVATALAAARAEGSEDMRIRAASFVITKNWNRGALCDGIKSLPLVEAPIKSHRSKTTEG